MSKKRPAESAVHPGDRRDGPADSGDPSIDLDLVRRRTSIDWTGRSLGRLVDTHWRIESRRAVHWSDWWVAALPVVGLLDLALYVTLRSRPGVLALHLWPWAPPTLIVAMATLLVGALLSALRSRRVWTWYRGLAFLGACALVLTSGVYQTYPSSHDARPSTVPFRLPLDGPVTVAWGGPTFRTNYHVGSPAERWAYDLLVTSDGRSHRGRPGTPADYLSYGRDVRAPADGRVVALHDGDPDATPGRPDRGRRAGNHVVIDVARGEYLFIAHLRAHSLRVAVGEDVTQGQVLGQVGNSGNSSEPHVHLHLQDTPTPEFGEGIPMAFVNYRLVGTTTVVPRGFPLGGQRRGAFLGQIVERAEHVTATQATEGAAPAVPTQRQRQPAAAAP